MARPGANPPAVILVEPQLAENIGTAARAMMNTGLTDLRLVDPKQDWLSEKAVAASSGAEYILEKARKYARPEDAIADLQWVYAATARRREMVKPIMTARAGAVDIRGKDGLALGEMFGRERDGLTTTIRRCTSPRRCCWWATSGSRPVTTGRRS